MIEITLFVFFLGFFGVFLEGAFSKFVLGFSLQKHVFYEGVFQNLAFRSRLASKVPHTWSTRDLK